MSVDIEVNLDVDIEKGIQRIKRELRKLDDEDFDIGDLFDDLDLDLEDVDLGLDDDSIDALNKLENVDLGLTEEDRQAIERFADKEDVRINENRNTHRTVNVDREGLGKLEDVTERLEELDLAEAFGDGSRDVLELDIDEDELNESLLGEALLGDDHNEQILEKLRDIHNALRVSNAGLGLDRVNMGGVQRAIEGFGGDERTGEGVERLLNKAVLDSITPDGDGDSASSSPLRVGAGEVIESFTSDQTARRMQSLADPAGDLSRRAIGSPTDLEAQLGRLNVEMERMDENAGSVLRVLSKFRPTFRRIYAVTATLLPAIAGLAAQAAALTVALGGLAAAGGAVLLLGALGGEADTLAGSVSNLETRMNEFKRSLFQAFQPAIDTFGPTFDRVLASLVTNASELTDELIGLQGIEPLIFDGIEAGTDMVEEMIADFNEFKPATAAVARDFGNLVTTRLPDFLQGVAREGLRSYDSLVKIGEFLYELLFLIYNVLKGVLLFIEALSVLTPVLRILGRIIGSDLFQSLFVLIGTVLTAIGLTYGFAVALQALTAAAVANAGIMSFLSGTALGSFIASMLTAIKFIPSLIVQLYGLGGALGFVAGTLALVTAGLTALAGIAAIGAGFSKVADIMTPDMPGGVGSSSRFGGGTAGSMPSQSGDTTINVYGNPDQPTLAKMEDIATKSNHDEDMRRGNFGAPIGGY